VNEFIRKLVGKRVNGGEIYLPQYRQGGRINSVFKSKATKRPVIKISANQP
jgi:hypothetical protein